MKFLSAIDNAEIILKLESPSVLFKIVINLLSFKIEFLAISLPLNNKLSFLSWSGSRKRASKNNDWLYKVENSKRQLDSVKSIGVAPEILDEYEKLYASNQNQLNNADPFKN